MTELRKVTGPSSPFGRHVGRLIAVVVIAVMVAIVKPWGAAVRPDPAPVPVAAASSSSSPIATPLASVRPRLYDFLSFGTNQPPPGWEMWPAGNLASFSFAMRIDLQPAVSASPAASDGASANPTPATTPIPVGSSGVGSPRGTVPDAWPTIRIPVGSKLDLIGINTPLGYVVQVVSLRRTGEDGSVTPVHAILGTSPWPDHFTIIGYGAEDEPDAMQPWPAGTYRLELSIDPGGVARTVEIVIDGPAPGASAEPSAGPSAVPAASPVPSAAALEPAP